MPNSNSKINIDYLPVIKEKLTEKRKRRKVWQTNRCPVFKNKLNRAIKAFKNLLDIKRRQDTRKCKQVKRYS